MIERNALAFAVIWPANKQSYISLIDGEGVECAQFKVEQPLKGSELAKVVPEGYYVAPCKNCKVVTIAGRPVVRTVGEFDSAVITEKPQLGFEERMQNLERRERRREKREQAREEETALLRQRLKEAEAVTELPQGAQGDAGQVDEPEELEAVQQAQEGAANEA